MSNRKYDYDEIINYIIKYRATSLEVIFQQLHCHTLEIRQHQSKKK